LLPAPLGYLLHHRGHTHTLLYALPQALLVWALICLFWPSARRLIKESANARIGLVLSLVLGFGLHLLMDYLNSYGIHPFHPYDSRWFFGDMVYILEPVFWVAFGVTLSMMVVRRWLRGLFAATLIGIPLFFAINGFLLWSSLVSLIVLAVAVSAVQHKAGGRSRAALMLAAMISMGFIGIQSVASAQARFTVAQRLNGKDPNSRVLDVAMTPFPTNPLCWTFVSIESNAGTDTYRLRRGLLSLAPDILPVTACPASLSERPNQREVLPAIAILFEREGDLHALRMLRNRNCHFEAWLRFARAPLLIADEASDLRFAASPRGNFTTMNLSEFENRECPQHVPAWDFPRRDLLTLPASQ
jgi:inner membrane protein